MNKVTGRAWVQSMEAKPAVLILNGLEETNQQFLWSDEISQSSQDYSTQLRESILFQRAEFPLLKEN